MLLHEPNPCSALSSPILYLCQIPHSNNRAQHKPRIINTTWSFLLNAVSPGWMEAETIAIGWQHSQQSPPRCQHPRGDEAMVAQGRLQCILTSPCLGLWHKILKFTSSLLSASSLAGCSHPEPGQGSRQFSQTAVSAPRPLPSSQWAQSPRASTNVLLPQHPRNIPLLLKHRNNKALPTAEQCQEGKASFPQQQGPRGSLWTCLRHKWPHTGPAPKHGSSTHFRKDLGFCRCLLLRTHFCCAEGGTVSKSPSWPSTALHYFPVFWVEGQQGINWAAWHYKLWQWHCREGKVGCLLFLQLPAVVYIRHRKIQLAQPFPIQIILLCPHQDNSPRRSFTITIAEDW